MGTPEASVRHRVKLLQGFPSAEQVVYVQAALDFAIKARPDQLNGARKATLELRDVLDEIGQHYRQLLAAGAKVSDPIERLSKRIRGDVQRRSLAALTGRGEA